MNTMNQGDYRQPSINGVENRGCHQYLVVMWMEGD